MLGKMSRSFSYIYGGIYDKIIYLAWDCILTTTRVQMTLIDFFSLLRFPLVFLFILYHIRISMNIASFSPMVLFSFKLEVNGSTYIFFPL